jgi:branched-chain amino acid aminotransferase
MTDSLNGTDWSKGAGYVDGRFCPIAEAKIPITDWGYPRSDVTYGVVGVYYGAFFRLDDHIRRFRASMDKLRLKPKESDEDIARILTALVRKSGLRETYVAMDCLRGKPGPGVPYHPAFGRAYLACFAIPWVWLFTEEQQTRGVHAMIASTPRIPAESIDPTVKNFHWGDLTKASFEAFDAGFETAVLLDRDGYLTEGPGYNVFVVIDGVVVSPPRGVLEGIIPKAPPADSRWGFPRAGFSDSMAREDSRHAISGQIARGLFGRGAARAGPPVEERQPEPPASLVGRGSERDGPRRSGEDRGHGPTDAAGLDPSLQRFGAGGPV